jgi:hypothetical protein
LSGSRHTGILRFALDDKDYGSGSFVRDDKDYGQWQFREGMTKIMSIGLGEMRNYSWEVLTREGKADPWIWMI